MQPHWLANNKNAAGGWPLRLNELSGLELLKSEGIDFNSEPMGYEAAADRDVAYLWINSPGSNQLPETCPVLSDQQLDVIKTLKWRCALWKRLCRESIR